MNKNPLYNQQTEPKQWKPEVEEIRIYQNLESGRDSVSSISENKYWGPCQKESGSGGLQLTIFESSQVH